MVVELRRSRSRLHGLALLFAQASVLVSCAPSQTKRINQANQTAAVSDRDGDKIADRCDRCPDQPEDYDQTADHDGCPEAVQLTASFHPFSEKVYFAEGKAALGKNQQAVLNAALASLNKGRTAVLACVGRVAAAEQPAFAHARARAVRRWFLKKGIAQDRVHAFADSSGPAGRRPETQRHVWLIAITLKPQHWYQSPLSVLRWNGKALVRTHAKWQKTPTGKPRCP
jgi:outer membrane protein OmpA-like peptidoglycan-associated protein